MERWRSTQQTIHHNTAAPDVTSTVVLIVQDFGCNIEDGSEGCVHQVSRFTMLGQSEIDQFQRIFVYRGIALLQDKVLLGILTTKRLEHA